MLPHLDSLATGGEGRVLASFESSDAQEEAWREAQWRAWAYQPMFPFVYQDALGRRYVSWPGSPFADPFGSQFLEESRLTNFCMRAKGWELEPVEKK